MNSTETRLAEATRRLNALKDRHQVARSAAEAARTQAGSDFEAVADGAPVPTEEARLLAAMVAEELTLASMVQQAERALSDATDIAFARGVLEVAEQMQAILRTYEEAARKVDNAVQVLAIEGTAMGDAARQIVGKFRALRGRSTTIGDGILAIDWTALSHEQVHHLAQQALAYYTRWWRYDRAMPFMPGALGAIAPLTGQFAELMGLTALSNSARKSATADMAADGAPLPVNTDDDFDLSQVPELPALADSGR